MIPTHGVEHERLLEQATCGDIARDDARLTAALAECPECRNRMEGLEAVEGLLGKAASEQRQTLASLDLAREAPGSDLVGPFLRARAEERRRASPWLPMAAAAALVATTGGVWIATQMGSGAQHEFLGSEKILFMGAVDGVVVLGGGAPGIRWETTSPMPPGGGYQIRILDAEHAPLDPDAEPRRLDQPSWIPSPEEEESLPDEFLLSVTVVDALGQPQHSRSVLVQR